MSLIMPTSISCFFLKNRTMKKPVLSLLALLCALSLLASCGGSDLPPDDRTGNVCYVSAYAIKNPEEDRAETLAKLFDTVYAEHDGSLFAHEVLWKKGTHWEKMIQETFSLPEETELFSDFFKKS